MDPGKQPEPVWWRNPFLWLPFVALVVLSLVVLPLAIDVSRSPTKGGLVLPLVAGAVVGAAIGFWCWLQVQRLGPDTIARIRSLPTRALDPEERSIKQQYRLRSRVPAAVALLISFVVARHLPVREGAALVGAEAIVVAATIVPQSLSLWRRASRLRKQPPPG